MTIAELRAEVLPFDDHPTPRAVGGFKMDDSRIIHVAPHVRLVILDDGDRRLLVELDMGEITLAEFQAALATMLLTYPNPKRQYYFWYLLNPKE